MQLIPILCLALVPVQDSLIHSTFATNEGGWAVVDVAGKGANISVVRDAADLKVGTGSLKLEYELKAGQIAAVTLPVVAGTLAKAKSFHF